MQGHDRIRGALVIPELLPFPPVINTAISSRQTSGLALCFLTRTSHCLQLFVDRASQ